MDVLQTKVLVLCLLATLRLLFGLIPLRIARSLTPGPRVEHAVSLCLCFGGGVLLATCFVHMLPEVRESLSKANIDSNFPYAELLVCCGFFLVNIIEEIVHWIVNVHSITSDDNSSQTRVKSAKIAPAHSHAVLLHASSLSIEKPRVSSSPEVPLSDQESTKWLGHLRGLLVVVALSFHSIFEGLAIGLQPTPRDVWYLFTAVSIHACAILFCMGLELVTSGTRLVHAIVYMVTLAVVSPIGVAIGIAVTTSDVDSAVHALIVGVLQGFAAGTILYITFFEILERERRKQTGCSQLRLLFILLGFALMVGLQAIGTSIKTFSNDN